MRANYSKYKVTCLKCGSTDVVTIDELNHQVSDYAKKIDTPFLSMRWRRDLQWGFECRCGNDTRLAKQEEKYFGDLVQGDPMSIKKIADSLKLPDKKRFKVEAA